MPEGRQKFRSSLFKGLQVQGSALVAPAGAKLPRTAIGMSVLVAEGSGPCGGTPPSTAVDTSPFRGGRPKSRLRRLAVGLLRSPLEERFAAGFVPKKMGAAVLLGRQAAVSYSGVMVGMGPIAGFLPTGQEA